MKTFAVLKAGLLIFCLTLTAACGGAKTSQTARNNNAGTLAVNLSEDIPGPPPEDAGIQQANPHPPAPAPAGELIEIREKMFIAQINDIYLNPEDYLGKTLVYEGLFDSYLYPETGVTYRYVIRYGPGCCGTDGNAGFEVSWDDAPPAQSGDPAKGLTLRKYPKKNDWVEVRGVLKAYDEDGFEYLHIVLSSLKVLDVRGAEYVNQ
jgi:uncharacterized membrane protein YcgQ (UPF0703/DUF1980 family)